MSLAAYYGWTGDNWGVPVWVIVAAATAMALGTASGGWRIIKTMGHKIVAAEADPRVRGRDDRRDDHRDGEPARHPDLDDPRDQLDDHGRGRDRAIAGRSAGAWPATS